LLTQPTDRNCRRCRRFPAVALHPVPVSCLSSSSIISTVSYERLGQPADARKTVVLARRACLAVARTGVAKRFPRGLVDRVRCRFFEMRAGDVVAIVGALTAAEVSASIAGGWGIDALLGRQSRRHKDLDLIVDASDAAQATARKVLHDLGYEEVDKQADAGKWMPLRVILREPGGRTIDLLPVHFEGGATVRDGETAAAPLVPAALVEGVVGGHPVSCLSPSVQLTFHTDYAPRRIDRHDLALLSSQFGSAPCVPHS